MGNCFRCGGRQRRAITLYSSLSSEHTESSQETPPPTPTPPPSLNEVIAQFKALYEVTNVDDLIEIIEDLLQRRTGGKSVEGEIESSRSVASLFIDSGATFFKVLNEHGEKSRAETPEEIIGDVLGKIGNVYWLVAGLSAIGYILGTMSAGYKICLDLLQKLVDLLDHVKKLDYRLPYQEERLRTAMELIVSGCIWCASQMPSYKLSGFFKTTTTLRVMDTFSAQVRSLERNFIWTMREHGAVDNTESKYVGPDVFLSHSGVQKNFVRQLYRDLTTEGVSCFFDESRESLSLAEKWAPLIFEGADTCRVAVLLLSIDFISSTWPMLELSAFLKAKKSGKNSNLKILPLFFKISPHDLKGLTSDAQDIPNGTKPEISEKTRIEWKDISEETRIEWNEALREVRKINGLQFKEGEDEVSFRDEIIKEIRILLPPSPTVSMPVRSVGLAEAQAKVIKLLELTSADTPPMAVVIYGFGGIGKTTLAEAVVAKMDLKPYHHARVNFDIGSSKKDIRKMQEQILNGMFPKRTKTKLTDCCQGRTVLTMEFRKEGNKPIFLFIDNAIRKQDLEDLLPRNMVGLPKGSRILVTTRNLGATDMFIEVEAGLKRQQYPVQPLSYQEAKNFLLQDTANRQLDNIQEEDLKRILNICKGVPLVLKIVRGHFRKQGYRADKCSQILEALERGEQIKEEDLGRTLTDFVYDQLEESGQQAFLDICCFLNDMDPSHVECIVGEQALTSLEEAAFVQRSDDKKTLIVHDIIRERGRNKAGSTRIMNVESLIDAANEQRLKDIRGVWLVDRDESGDERECVVEEQHLKAMTKLRVLALGQRMRVSHQCEVTFKELRYLEVGGDIPFLPVNLERLQKLAFYVGPLFKKGFTMYKLPKELRVLIAARQSYFNESTYSEESTSIRAVKNSSLQELDLSKLENLQKIPPRLHLLTSLEILRWKEWTRMEELPEEVCQLTLLNQLILSNWTSLTCLPEGFGQLTALKELNLYKCKALQCLPGSFVELKALKDLHLSHCEALERLPESMGELKALKYLNLSSCKALKRLPESFGQLEVEKLELRWCISLQCLPESFGQLKALKYLNLFSCEALKRLPESLGKLKALESLHVSYCNVLECLPESFGQLAALVKLELTGCTALQCLPESFGELKALASLDLSSCHSLELLPESFGQLSGLENLKLRGCIALQCLPQSFGQLEALKDLNLLYCYALVRLPESFGKLTSLRYIRMGHCPARYDLRQFRASLKHVTIEDEV